MTHEDLLGILINSRKNVNVRFEHEGPPCKKCVHWTPILQFREHGFDGANLCSAEEMFSDFSCFEEMPI